MKNISRLTSETTNENISLLNDFVTKWNSKNLELFSTVFTDDAEYIDIVGQIAIGKNDLIEQHRFPFEVVNKIAIFSLDNLYIRSVAENHILVTGNWVCENSTTPKGDILPIRSGVIQVICRNENNEWKISLVHNTDLSQVYSGIVNTELRFHTTQK
ncbi:MAG: hypothetical protein SFY32_13510 [Bacteroidota bacterium]|nr:hypothetical protein [Bacteroidota bacterium]